MMEDKFRAFMADLKPVIEKHYPNTDIADYIGQKAADELGDIQLKVPNAKDFLNTQTTDIDTYNAQKKALSNYINMIRKKYGEKDIPQPQLVIKFLSISDII